MDKLVIEGGHALNGEIRVKGAKNAALPIMAAALLTSDECFLENVPHIEDVEVMLDVLQRLGVRSHWEGANTLGLQADGVTSHQIDPELASKFRASFLVAGPMLARFGEAQAPHPGGCSIGTRPVSVDLRGFQNMGADVQRENGNYVMRAGRLQGERFTLDYPSHTGTENLLMAACLAEGTTTIENASVEPEVVDLANCLNAMGACIMGAGTGIIQIEGVNRLHGVSYRVMPDRLEAATYALAAIVTGGQVVLRERLSQYLGALTSKFIEAGAVVQAEKELYSANRGAGLSAVDIRTFPYPGFPTDCQAPFATLMTQAKGESFIHETMYDGRLAYTGELHKMGAHVRVQGQTAVIQGPTPLQGTSVRALDIRSGAAVVLAGLVAEGITEISDVYYIDRGYESIEARLASLGAVIKRVQA
ncbi:MAG: UDP-N-acetylglucosamine 1-carboxyvinyltransferase [Chloroflexi bacterium]|nr:UDP-N-acetylglucosamine 1-carboxyvinyltransferase [Chloroflexota bacterium]